MRSAAAAPGVLLGSCALLAGLWWSSAASRTQDLGPLAWLSELCVGAADAMLSTGASAPAATRPATDVRLLSCEALADLPGKSMVTALVVFPSGAYTPPHRHPGAVSAFVVKGVVRSQMAGDSAREYAAGQTWFEPPGALHLFAENASATELAEVLATFVVDTGCKTLVIPEPPAG
jgi:quercetin dioxygenase-like cupin family protein